MQIELINCYQNKKDYTDMKTNLHQNTFIELQRYKV